MEFYDSDVRVILQVLQRENNTADAYAVRRACHELARLVTWRRELRLDMVEAGVLRTLATVVETHLEADPNVVVDCCRFLRRCISLKEPTETDVQSRVSEAGLLAVLRSALETHPMHCALFVEICQLMVLLSFDMPHAPHADNQIEMADTGLLRLVLEHAVQDTSGEDEAAHACEAINALLYENEKNALSAVEECALLRSLEELLARYPSSKRVVQESSQLLFQLLTLLPEVRDEIVVGQFIERILDYLETKHEEHDLELLWHTLKLFELLSRCHEGAKDELCRCRGAVVVIQATNSLFFSARKASHTLACLYYVGCMLLGQLAVDSDEPPGGAPNWPVCRRRVDHLLHSGAPQFALQIIKTLGADYTHVAEQAVRLLELIATIGSVVMRVRSMIAQ